MKRWLAALAATVLVAAGILLPATVASAHTPGDSATCTTLTVSHKQYAGNGNSKPNKITVRIDGVDVDSARFGGEFVKQYTFSPSWQAHTWQVIVTTPDGYDYNSGVKTTTPCERPKPEKPVGFEKPYASDAVSCETELVTRSHWKIVTSYTFDRDAWEWKAVETRVDLPDTTRPLNADEVKACAGDEPQTKVEKGEWVEESLNCQSRSVALTRTVTTTTFSLVGTKWVANEPVVTIEHDSRPKTDAEKYECLVTGAANGAAVIVADCGTATVTLTNEALSTKQYTASFVIYVGGEFYGAYAVAAGESEDVVLTFPEDSGDHEVTVRTGPAQGDKLLATATVTSDCEPNLVSNNPQVKASTVCGSASLEFSNDVELGENEYANPAEFAYTDASGETQTVTVEPNGEHVIVNIPFEEDSGSHEVVYWSPTGDRDGTTIVVETNCIPDVTEVPAGVKFVDVCGVDNDKVIVPEDTNELDYTVTDSRENGKGKVVVSVVAKEGFALPDGSPTSWSHIFTAEACGEDGELVVTGADPIPGSLLAGAALLLGSLLLVAARRRNGAFI